MPNPTMSAPDAQENTMETGGGETRRMDIVYRNESQIFDSDIGTQSYDERTVQDTAVKMPNGTVVDIQEYKEPNDSGYDIRVYAVSDMGSDGLVRWGHPLEEDHYDTREEADNALESKAEDWGNNPDFADRNATIESLCAITGDKPFTGNIADFAHVEEIRYPDTIVDERYVRMPDGRIADIELRGYPNGSGYDVTVHPMDESGDVLYRSDMEHTYFETRQEAEDGFNDATEHIEHEEDPDAYDRALENAGYEDDHGFADTNITVFNDADEDMEKAKPQDVDEPSETRGGIYEAIDDANETGHGKFEIGNGTDITFTKSDNEYGEWRVATNTYHEDPSALHGGYWEGESSYYDSFEEASDAFEESAINELDKQFEPQDAPDVDQDGSGGVDNSDNDEATYSDHVVDEDYVKEPDGRVADVTVFERPDGDGYDVESHPITANGTVLYGLDMDHEHYDTREEAESGMNDMSERLEIDGEPESYDEAIEDSAYADVGAYDGDPADLDIDHDSSPYDGDPADLDIDNDSRPMYSNNVVDEKIVQEPDGRTVDVSVYERPDGNGYDVESHPVLADGTVLYGIDMSHENFEDKEDAESSMHYTADKLEIDGDAEAYDEAMEGSAYDIEDFESSEPDMTDQDINDFNDENDRIDSGSSGIDTDDANRDEWDPDDDFDDWDSIG